MKCEKCKSNDIITIEISEIYDGYCMVFCKSCESLIKRKQFANEISDKLYNETLEFMLSEYGHKVGGNNRIYDQLKKICGKK